jgi:hypothetical protein
MEMTRALEAVLGIAVSYAKERLAFGRPVAKCLICRLARRHRHTYNHPS